MPTMVHRFFLTFGLLLSPAVAHAEAPRCGDPDLLRSLSAEMIDTIRTSVQMFSGFRIKAPAAEYDAKIIAMYQVGATDAERACHGTLVVSNNGTILEREVDYSTVATEDGATLFRWSAAADFINYFLFQLSEPPPRDTPSGGVPPAAAAPQVPEHELDLTKFPLSLSEPAPSTSSEHGLSFSGSVPYAKARTRLRSLGFTPFRAPGADRCTVNDTGARCYPETEACAGTGEGNCIYDWRRGSDTIKVFTVNDPPVVKSLECSGKCDPDLDFDQQLEPAKPTRRAICSSTGTVSGLDRRKDGFLSVRGGPGRDQPEVDRLHNGNIVSICEGRGSWFAIVYSPTGDAELCMDGLWSDPNQPSLESCRSGWVSSHFVGNLAD